MEKYTISDIFRYILKKWWIILIGAITFACALGMLKTLKPQPLESGYQYTANQLVRFNNHAIYYSGDKTEQYQNYNDIWFRNAFLVEYVEKLTEKYDMTSFCSDWTAIDITKKTEWLKEAVRSTAISNSPNYEFTLILNFTKSEKAYIEQHAEAFLTDFISYATETTKLLSPESSSTLINKSNALSENSISKDMVYFKYYVLGGVFGLLLSLVLVVFMFLSSKKVQSKVMYIQSFDIDNLNNMGNLAYDVCCYMIHQSKNGNRQLAICSTLSDYSMINKILDEFKKLKLTVSFGNLTDKTFSFDVAGALDKETCKQLRRPGSAVSKQDADGSYSLYLVTPPSNDLATLDLLSTCACVVFIEKAGESKKIELTESLERLTKMDKGKPPVCIAWEN